MNVRPAALIFNGESVLTLRYCYGNVHVFALPGGNPDPGESLEEALARELYEELGVTIEVNKMVICGEVIWDQIKKETLHMVFASKILTGIPVLNPTQTTALEIVWLHFTALSDTLLYPNVGNYILTSYNNKLESAHIGVINQPYIH